jgi:hypothetical protein
LVAGLGLLATQDERKTRDTVWLALGGGVSLLVLLAAFLWPSALDRHWGMDFAVEEPDPNQFLVVTPDNRQVVKDLGRAEWIDADKQSLRQGDIHVRIASVKVDVPGVKKEAKGPALPPALLIQVAVVNVGQLRLIPYQGLNKSDPPPILTDDKGTPYPLRRLHDLGLPHLVQRAVLGPAREVPDLLAFEPPPPDVDALKLEFPAAAWGGTGTCRFRIPRSMIVVGAPKGQARP